MHRIASTPDGNRCMQPDAATCSHVESTKQNYLHLQLPVLPQKHFSCRHWIQIYILTDAKASCNKHANTPAKLPNSKCSCMKQHSNTTYWYAPCTGTKVTEQQWQGVPSPKTECLAQLCSESLQSGCAVGSLAVLHECLLTQRRLG